MWVLVEVEGGEPVQCAAEILDQIRVPPLSDAAQSGEGLLDELEESALAVGRRVSKGTVETEWRALDERLASEFVASREPGTVWRDGVRKATAVTRAGRVELGRQLCFDRKAGGHVLPGNRALPAHSRGFFTRGAPQLACLLAADHAGATASRLFAWIVGGPISASHVRDLADEHGERIFGRT